MTNEEAKFILNAYRADGSDAGDPVFDAALEQARRDPALSAWFDRLQAFDRAVAMKINEVQPPPGLRESILAGGRVSSPQFRSAPAWWQRPAVLAAAAGIALFAVIALNVLTDRTPATASFESFVVADARNYHSHGGHGAGASLLQAALAGPASRLGERLPVNFDGLRTSGCRTIAFRGHDVLEVCFNRNGKWFHCYVMRRDDRLPVAASRIPAIAEHEVGSPGTELEFAL